MRAWIRTFATSRRGNVAVMFALALPLVIGGAGLGVETTYWYYKRLKMQAAADVAAHAGAIEARSGSANTDVVAVATASASDNGFASPAATITVNSPPLTGPSAGGDAVEVIIAAPADRFFTRLFSTTEVGLTARAVAKFTSASSACILALDPTASAAANFSGNTSITLDGCSVMSNSLATNSVQVQGSARLTVDCVIAAGNVASTAGMTLTECPAPITAAPQVGDPFSDLPVPVPSGACKNANGANLQPGRYCNGMNLSGTVNLQPGVYYVEGSDFRVNANANVTGSGVTIYLASGSNITMNGNSQTVLSAPTSGTYSGVLFFGDRNGTGLNTINGNNSSRLTGAIYFANQSVRYLGNFSGTSGCTQVVARTIEWSGSTTVAADCSALGMRDLPAYSLVQLSE